MSRTARWSCALVLGWPTGLPSLLAFLGTMLGSSGCGSSPPAVEPRRASEGARTEWLEGAWEASAQG